MPEITDEVIKKKHREFDQRIKDVLEEVRGKPKQINLMERLRQAKAKLSTKKLSFL